MQLFWNYQSDNIIQISLIHQNFTHGIMGIFESFPPSIMITYFIWF
jgi:hypothetical protein